MHRFFYLLAAFACGFSLNACSFLPTTGPSLGDIRDQSSAAKDVSLVMVTPALASQIAAVSAANTEAAANKSVVALQTVATEAPVMLEPGDEVSLTLWTTPMTTASDSSNIEQAALYQTALGTYTVDEAGNLVLPYAGIVHVKDNIIATSEQKISSRYASLGQFNQPQVILNMQTNNRQYVIVTGSANNPAIINWQTGGLTLSEAITKAGSYKEFSNAVNGRDLKTNSATIERGGAQYQLPMKLALASDIQLMPGDAVILGHRDDIRVQCLGGGWSNDTTQTYEYEPTLAEVVADGGGLSLNAANGEAVYVLSNDHTTIYQFAWDTLDGLRASQAFPVQSGDVVYVATSPSLTFQQVTSILFAAAYPVATAHAL